MDISYSILDDNPNSDPQALSILQKCKASLTNNRDPEFCPEGFLLQQGNVGAQYNRTLYSLCRKFGFYFDFA